MSILSKLTDWEGETRAMFRSNGGRRLSAESAALSAPCYPDDGTPTWRAEPRGTQNIQSGPAEKHAEEQRCVGPWRPAEGNGGPRAEQRAEKQCRSC